MKHLHSFLCFAVCLLLLASCQPSYKNVIPQNAVAVAEINIGKLAVKADVNGQQNDIKQTLIALVDDEELNKDIEELFANPLNSGIDFMKPLYSFLTLENEEPGVFCLIAVSDADKVKNMMKEEELIQTEDEENLTFVRAEERLIGVMNSDLLLIGSSNNKADYRRMLAQEKSQCFFATEAGKFMKQHTEDISLGINTAEIPSHLKRELKDMIRKETGMSVDDNEDMRNYLDALFNSRWVINFLSENGALSLNLFSDFPDNSMLNTQGAQPIDPKTLNHISTRNMLAFIAIGINGKATEAKINEYMQEYASLLGEEISGMITDYIVSLNGTAVIAAESDGAKDKEPFVNAILPVSIQKTNHILRTFDSDPSKDGFYIDGNETVTTISTNERFNLQSGNTSSMNAGVNLRKNDFLYGYINLPHLTDMLESYSNPRKDIPELRNYYQCIYNALRETGSLELRTDNANELHLNLVFNNTQDNALAITLRQAMRIFNAYQKYEQAQEKRWKALMEEWAEEAWEDED